MKNVGIAVLLLIIAFYIKTNWQYWTQNEEQWRALCIFPEIREHIQTVSDYRICLANRRITPTDKDIRMMCNYQAKDEYNSQNGTEPSRNSLYLDCVHGEGLPN